MIELTHDALAVARCTDAVRRPNVGGIVVFIGCVRDVSEGESVRFLEYEAYEAMAMDKLNQVADEVKGRWPVKAIAIQHRLGHLDVGEEAVVVAVGCEHRSEAFAACQFAIDRLKDIVPIWKKEYGQSGAVWVGMPSAAST